MGVSRFLIDANRLILFKTLIYVGPRATGPTILVTVGITIRKATSMLLGKLLGLSLLKLSLELTTFSTR
jgi:hypothetical protein